MASAASDGAEAGAGENRLFSPEQLEQLKEAFAIFDLDDSGTISVDELAEAMESLDQHLSDDELHTLMVEADSDGNGAVDFEEFTKIIAHKMDMLTPEEEEQKRKLDTEDDIREYVESLPRRDLKIELTKRGEPVHGNKRALQKRLFVALNMQAQQSLAFDAMIKVQEKADVEVEANGAVYTVGDNGSGQLGLGDREPRTEFTPIRQLKGRGVVDVTIGGATVMSRTEAGDLYSWGGDGIGPLGIPQRGGTITEARSKGFYLTPIFVKALQGQGVEEVSIGPSHGMAVTAANELYMWGSGQSGQLGRGAEPKDFETQYTPVKLDLGSKKEFPVSVAAGPCHSMCVCESGTWAVHVFILVSGI